MGHFLFLLYTQHAVNWNEGFKIVNAFLNNISPELYTGFSFNRYFGMGVLLSHIAVRFDFADDQTGKERAEEIAENLKSQGRIVAYSD